ncbi:hypothetical protein CVT25_013617 [Psilocybe cyanescens]|uniref:Protein SYM1 n=1 Tax=Psilocybe cyanescens TaxID=93625 RepID=A0A409WTF2_PSICY|nr:hypothetical protein CVT25_013617 [Psilocybe cyanescens]
MASGPRAIINSVPSISDEVLYSDLVPDCAGSNYGKIYGQSADQSRLMIGVACHQAPLPARGTIASNLSLDDNKPTRTISTQTSSSSLGLASHRRWPTSFAPTTPKFALTPVLFCFCLLPASPSAALIRRPMLTQCLTAGVLFGAGDLIAQQAVEGKGRNHDWMRTGRLTFYGGAIFGPAMTKWYQLLNQMKFPSPTKALVYRVWLDQALLTPVAVAFFYGSMSLLEGKPEEAMPRIQAVRHSTIIILVFWNTDFAIRKAYVPTLIRNWGVYIPTQIINFSLVPPHLRLVVVSVVSLFWNTYLSAANASAQKQTAITGTGIEKVEVAEF